MIIKILIGNEPYIIDQYVNALTEGYDVFKSSSFGIDELDLVRQQTIFGKTAVLVSGKLNTEDEKQLTKLIQENPDYPGALIYVPGYEDKRKKLFKLEPVTCFNKPERERLSNILKETAKENNVSISDDVIAYLVEYSEYYEEDAISLYDLIGVIRTSSGSSLSREHINNSLLRNSKDDAFKLLKLIESPSELVEYMNRLSSNPYVVIGALLYALRIVGKLHVSTDIGIHSYQMRQYSQLASIWTMDDVISKMKTLIELKEKHEPTHVMNSLILSTLLS